MLCGAIIAMTEWYCESKFHNIGPCLTEFCDSPPPKLCSIVLSVKLTSVLSLGVKNLEPGNVDTRLEVGVAVVNSQSGMGMRL